MFCVMEPPVDKYRLVYITFIILGVSSLLPWNLFITAHEYYFYKLRNTTISDNMTGWTAHKEPSGVPNHSELESETYYQHTFENYFTLTGSMSNLFGNGLTAILSTRVLNQIRMGVGHLLVIAALVPTVCFSLLNTDTWQTTFFILSLIFVNIANVGSSGFICGSSMGLAAKFPQDYIQAQIMGQAVAGIATSLASIISQALTPKPQLNGLAYFLLAAVFSLISIICYFAMLRTRFAKVFVHTAVVSSTENSGKNEYDEASDTDPLLAESCEVISGEHELSDELRQFQGFVHTRKPEFFVVLKKISYHAVLIVMTFTVSLVVFPALASAVISTSKDSTWRAYFVPVSCFLLFNCGDFIGRLMTEWIRWPSPKSPLHFVIAVLRIGLIPLFMICNVQPRHYIKNVYITQDWAFILLMAVLSVSNGYSVSLNGMYGAKDVCGHEMELAGSLISLSYVIGVLLGSALSFGVVYFV